jgi:signal transduction histidine kinase/CheY-like chemotaxis protein
MAAISNMRLQSPNQRGVCELPLGALPIPAALVDSQGTLLAANEAWIALRPQSALGKNSLDWCSTDVGEALVRGIRNAAEGGESSFAKEYTTPEGRFRRILASPAGVGILLLDVDLAPADDLKKKQAEKMETVGRLVGGVAHDFANLLTMIAGYSDILLNRIGERDPLRPELDEIRKAANRGARLTSQLLGFTRGQAVQPRPLDLNAIVADLHRMLGLVIGEYVELETSLAANLHKIVADSGQMEQVIINLILNARDAMPTGGRIRIETNNAEIDHHAAQMRGIRPGPGVMLSISDNGSGIDSEAIAHIFEPFYTTKAQGTGLGLSTVHRIVKESGGDISVASAPGRGAMFTICFPMASQDAEHTDAAAGPRPTVAGSETILLVEDEEGVRRLLTHVLHKRGYHVIEAPNADEALRLFHERGPEIHLVLTDMVMPRISGRELGDRLRELRPDLKIIYMSGYTDDVLVRTGALGPGMSFLQKPLRPEMLASKVREALDR